MCDATTKCFSYSGEWKVENVIAKVKNRVEGSFYLCNLSDVTRKFYDWNEKMPRVKPFYAVKCNDDEGVLKTLASVGCSFDCASAGEIDKILSLDVEPNRIIYANTTKMESHIEFAKKRNVNLMTFDNEDEVHKIARAHPFAELVLRIRFNSEKAKYKLGKKFGCDIFTEAPELLALAKSLKLKVVGISFHIGSSCEEFGAYVGAIEASRGVFEIAEALGFKIRLLDLGGGYPGDSFSRIDEYCGLINDALEEHYPSKEFPDLLVISEPGRYFVESAFTLVASIHSRKLTRNTDGEIEEVMYYLNEGVYSNFLFIPLGPETVEPKILKNQFSNLKFKSTLWGPTCDSTDVICLNIDIELLNIGDVIYFNSMGAYTIPLRTPFNGFDITPILHFVSEADDPISASMETALFDK